MLCLRGEEELQAFREYIHRQPCFRSHEEAARWLHKPLKVRPMPVKLGLAGGPLIVAILLAKYGPQWKMITFTTNSANMMIREIGISLFLAAVGLGAGQGFVEAIANGGYWWILFGFAITVLPLLIVGIIARKGMKMDYFTVMGLMSGAMTDPPALAYANSVSSNDRSAVAYATVYPLTMFLRIFTAQILTLIALS